MRLPDLLDFHARAEPTRLFAADERVEIGYGDAAAHVARLAAGMRAGDLRRGDRVALLARNRADYVLGQFACARAGVCLVLLNFHLAEKELEYILGDCTPRWLVTEARFQAVADRLSRGLDTVERVVMLDADGDPDSWLAIGQGDPVPDASEVSLEDDLYIMYTSGTTGRPKGAVHTQRSLLTTVTQLGIAWDLHAGERQLVIAPLFHAAASIMALTGIARGGSLIIHERFDPEAVVAALHEARIDRTAMVPSMIHACLEHASPALLKTPPPLRSVIYGASAIETGLLERAMRTFGCGFIQGFGQTESNTLTTLTEADHRRALDGHEHLLKSAGRAVPGTALRIVDADGRDLPPGEVGEIVARGEQSMRGYWRRDEATAATVVDGWLHTGDAGCLDDEGYLYIRDRLTDMIISGGENVYPREVENVLAEHPQVLEVAVIGMPDPRWGEAVTAVVVPRPGEVPALDDLQAFAAGQLARYKVPRRLETVTALPRNATGKVLKRELRITCSR